MPLTSIHDNPAQPRSYLDPEAFERLKQSIRAYGVVVPIVVRPTSRGFELVAGQRRLRASRELGLPSIPVVIRDLRPAEAMEISLLENLQREGLADIDTAAAFQRILREFPAARPERLAANLGRPPQEVDRDLALLRMPRLLQQAVVTGLIDADTALRLHASGEDPVRALSALVHGGAERAAAEVAARPPLARTA